MPYVITTREVLASSYSEFGDHYCRTPSGELCGPYESDAAMRADFVTRRAVATLDKACAAARQIVWGSPNWGETRYARHIHEADTLPEQGGTVGPLPDGTLIVVERVRWSAINPDMDGGPMGPEDAEIEIDRFNAAQEG